MQKPIQKPKAKKPAGDAGNNGSDLTHIGDLHPDPRNPRRHNPSNVGLIADSLQEVGAARSIVIDEDGRVLAGNGVIEAAGQVGITKLKVVDADGETVVAVRRTGLTERQKTRVALFDNRTSELGDWDNQVLSALVQEDKDILAKLLMDDVALIDNSDESDTRPKHGRYSEVGASANMVVSIGLMSETVPRKKVEALCEMLQEKWADMPLNHLVDAIVDEDLLANL